MLGKNENPVPNNGNKSSASDAAFDLSGESVFIDLIYVDKLLKPGCVARVMNCQLVSSSIFGFDIPLSAVDVGEPRLA